MSFLGKIIEKTRPQVSSSKIMYQRICMEDEKGGQIGVTIYGDDIASYVEAIKCRKESFENGSHLKSLREAVEGAKVSVKKAILRSISDFKAVKGENTTHGQCIWICGCVQNLDKKMIRLYLGCDACGTKTYEDIGTKYKCSKSSCTTRTSTAVARMIFQFDLVDITGSWNVTLFSDDASKVLGIEPDKLYRMEYEDREKFYAEVAELLARKSIYIKFTPGATFAKSRILKWVMKEVQIFGCADGLHFGAKHDWWSLMFFGYFVNIDGGGSCL
ncbi:hypothetical protein Cgig2_003717 [Carnegiea gigantea]|uniref:Replication factor A C-terminal domain-containing protein n=1 Tax=Carnegiea gigantea TaxID=171969 RepID=A0A9Q1KFZ8_9CARY|nr:hypothetical protein Cgig2_003717 [Carnegiea gigantea]